MRSEIAWQAKLMHNRAIRARASHKTNIHAEGLVSGDAEVIPVEKLIERGLLGKSALRPKASKKAEAIRLDAIESARMRYAQKTAASTEALRFIKAQPEFSKWLGLLRDYGEPEVEGSDPHDFQSNLRIRLFLLEQRIAGEKASKDIGALFAAAKNGSERRQIRLRLATPKWADWDKIAAVYGERDRLTAETGIPHHVDHIEPLAGKTVCGLHVHWNLRAIPAIDNMKKGARVLH